MHQFGNNFNQCVDSLPPNLWMSLMAYLTSLWILFPTHSLTLVCLAPSTEPLKVCHVFSLTSLWRALATGLLKIYRILSLTFALARVVKSLFLSAWWPSAKAYFLTNLHIPFRPSLDSSSITNHHMLWILTPSRFSSLFSYFFGNNRLQWANCRKFSVLLFCNFWRKMQNHILFVWIQCCETLTHFFKRHLWSLWERGEIHQQIRTKLVVKHL